MGEVTEQTLGRIELNGNLEGIRIQKRCGGTQKRRRRRFESRFLLITGLITSPMRSMVSFVIEIFQMEGKRNYESIGGCSPMRFEGDPLILRGYAWGFVSNLVRSLLRGFLRQKQTPKTDNLVVQLP
jgi:hypothetical protein